MKTQNDKIKTVVRIPFSRIFDAMEERMCKPGQERVETVFYSITKALVHGLRDLHVPYKVATRVVDHVLDSELQVIIGLGVETEYFLTDFERFLYLSLLRNAFSKNVLSFTTSSPRD